MNLPKNLIVYALQLEENKWYVGRTTKLEFRIDDHVNGTGSVWTNKYKPIIVDNLYTNCDTFDEDKYTLMYMSVYGIDNVRGGSFCQEHLDSNTIQILNKMLNGAADKCYNCGYIGHFARDCPFDETKLEEIWSCPKCEKDFDFDALCDMHEKYCRGRKY